MFKKYQTNSVQFEMQFHSFSSNSRKDNSEVYNLPADAL